MRNLWIEMNRVRMECDSAIECNIWTILDAAYFMLVNSRLLIHYWLKTVWTAIYLQNLIPSRQNPDIMPTEIWYGKRQSISHLYTFRATAYTYIPLNLHSSKLGPCIMCCYTRKCFFTKVHTFIEFLTM